MGQYLPEIHTDVDEGSSYLNNTAITVFATPSCSDTLNKKILQMNENEREQFMLARDNYYYLKKKTQKTEKLCKDFTDYISSEIWEMSRRLWI